MVKDDANINKYFPNYSNGKLPSSDFFFGICLFFIKILIGAWILGTRFLISSYWRLSNQKAFGAAAWRGRKVHRAQEESLRMNNKCSMDLGVRRFLIAIFVIDPKETESIYSRKLQRWQVKEKRKKKEQRILPNKIKEMLKQLH